MKECDIFRGQNILSYIFSGGHDPRPPGSMFLVDSTHAHAHTHTHARTHTHAHTYTRTGPPPEQYQYGKREERTHARTEPCLICKLKVYKMDDVNLPLMWPEAYGVCTARTGRVDVIW